MFSARRLNRRLPNEPRSSVVVGKVPSGFGQGVFYVSKMGDSMPAFYLSEDRHMSIHGPRVRRLRISRGITTASLASQAGWDLDDLHRLEADRLGHASVGQVLGIAQALGVSVDAIRD